MPPAQQEAEGDLNEPVLDNQNTDVRTEERELAPAVFARCGQRVSLALGYRSKRVCR